MPNNEYHSQVVFQSSSGLAKDRFINDFYFIGGADTQGGDGNEAIQCANKLSEFYTVVQPLAQHSVGHFLAGHISREVTVNTYVLGQPKPRKPLTAHFTIPTPITESSLPEEVALCLSFYAEKNAPRQRGRIYIGPFNTAALATSSGPARPSEELMQAIVFAGAYLKITDTGVQDSSNVILDGLFLANRLLDGQIQTISSDLGFSYDFNLPSFMNKLHFPPLHPVRWAQHSEIGSGTKEAPVRSLRPVTTIFVDDDWDGVDGRRLSPSRRILG
jgi:hypothetical protein